MVVVSVLLLGPWVFIGMGMAVVLVGFLWSPIAALLCARAARSRGLAPMRYAFLGVLYSTLMIVPWILLWQRLRRNRVPQRPLVLSYWVLYVGIWGCGALALPFNVILLFVLVHFFDGGASGSSPWPTRIDYVFSLMLCSNLAAMVVSARGLIKRWREDYVPEGGLLARSSILLPKDYVMPFAYVIIVTVLSAVVYFTMRVWS